MVSNYSVSFTDYKTHTIQFIRNNLLSKSKHSVPIIQNEEVKCWVDNTDDQLDATIRIY
jgi:hypothetical protein